MRKERQKQKLKSKDSRQAGMTTFYECIKLELYLYSMVFITRAFGKGKVKFTLRVSLQLTVFRDDGSQSAFPFMLKDLVLLLL